MNFLQHDPIQCDSPREIERSLADYHGQRLALVSELAWVDKHIERLKELLVKSKQSE